ncbi:hypothetical protein EV182_002606 [Spiromyces aspiralis]|uniref:Uncharacterized protein n=1 Tax=Spiromyces aspiralis TaxID=68401 RepID=A0ACC1HVP3_9FUNG|nr:hypothetical protein EV182_002606 [Spiromyces aspiralis]
MSGSTSETPTHSGSALRRNSGQKPSTPHLHNIESTPLASPARLSLFENVQYPDSPTEPTSESEGSKSGNGTKPLVNSPLTAPRSITFADTSDRQGENDGEDSNGAAINGIGAGSKPILDTAGTRVQAVPGAVIKRVNELKDVRSKNRQSLGILDFNKLGNFEIGDQLVDTDLIAGLSPGESIAADAVQMGDNSGGNKAVSPNVGAIAALQSPEASQEDASGVAQQGLFTSGPADGEDRSGAEVHAGQAQESDESMLPTPLSSGAITPSASPKQGPHRPAISAVASSGSGTHHTFMTPKTEAGRYWHGPMATPVPQRPRSPTVAGVLSPVPPNTQGRASQIEKYIDQLARGSSIDDNLFRGLVRFFKGESNLDRLEQADNTFMARLVASCVSFIQRPGETRDAMFVKDSCIDVLRMLVRRQAHLLTRLDQVRGLFWEMLRCRFMDSPILSGSAEDMLLDMVTHLDPKLSIDLFEDFLARSPLAAHPDLEVNGAPMSRVPTPPELDPMNVLGMANSIACVLELTSSLLGRLGSEDGLVVEAVSRLFPYVVVAFSHSRTQVRKAAIEPIFSAKQVLSIPNEEFVAALSRDSLPDDSSRPIAAGISILRPFLSRLEATHRKLILLYAQSQNR